jgi:hypothetical protein
MRHCARLWQRWHAPQWRPRRAHRGQNVGLWQAWLLLTSGPSSINVAQEKTTAQPSSADVRGTTTSMETTTLLSPPPQGVLRIPPTLWEMWEDAWHSPSPLDGCVTTQVSTTLVGEVRRVYQPHRVPADLYHLHPHCRGNEAIMANYFPMALTGTAQSWLMYLPQGSYTLGKSCVISS